MTHFAILTTALQMHMHIRAIEREIERRPMEVAILRAVVLAAERGPSKLAMAAKRASSTRVATSMMAADPGCVDGSTDGVDTWWHLVDNTCRPHNHHSAMQSGSMEQHRAAQSNTESMLVKVEARCGWQLWR